MLSYAPPAGAPPPSGYGSPYGSGTPAAPSGYGAPPSAPGYPQGAPPPAPAFPGAPHAQASQYGHSYAPPAGGPPPHPHYNPSYMGVPGSPAPPQAPGAYAQQPQQPYGQAPQQAYYPQSNVMMYLGVPIPPPPPNPPSTVGLPGFDAHRPAEAARKAMKGFGTNEKALTEAIAPLDALQVEAVKRTFESLTGKGLIREVESEVSGYYEYALRAKLLGPVLFDCWLLHKASSGAGTDETVLTEVLLDRTNAEIQLLKAAYHATYRHDLTSIIRSELSQKTERLFNMALAGNRDNDTGAYVDQAKVQDDVRKLYEAGKGRMGTDEITISSIIVSRSPSHLRAVVQAYGHAHGRLSKDIKSEFSGHMESALLYIVEAYEGDGAGIDRDVELIEQSMRGMGTKDEKLIRRIMRVHWNKARFDAIKRVYEQKHRTPLIGRVKGETSGDYRDFMCAVIASR